MEQQKKKIVYILGAGASKDFGMPLGNEFFKKGLYLLGLKEKVSFKDIPLNHIEEDLIYLQKNLPRIYPNLSDNPEEWPPVEEILTISYELDKEIFDKTKDYVFEVLTTSQRDPFMSLFEYQYECKFNYLERYMMLKQYFEKMIGNPLLDISFVSFNYDTLIDSILEELLEIDYPELTPTVTDYTYKVHLLDINNKENIIRGNGVKLIKPHGSINLAYCDKCKKAFYSIGSVIYSIKHERKGYECVCGARLQPLVCPPLFGKAHKGGQYLFEYMNEMLSLVKKEVESADRIIIVGYSFPDYDIEIKSSIIDGIRSNTNNIEWQIIDKGDNIKNKLASIISRNYKLYCEGFINYIVGEKEGQQAIPNL